MPFIVSLIKHFPMLEELSHGDRCVSSVILAQFTLTQAMPGKNVMCQLKKQMMNLLGRPRKQDHEKKEKKKALQSAYTALSILV